LCRPAVAPALNERNRRPKKGRCFSSDHSAPTGNADRLNGPDLPPARLEFLKSVILDTSTYSSHPQRDGGIATWQRHWPGGFSCWRGSARRYVTALPNGPIAARNLCIRRCVMASVRFKTNRGTFVFARKRDAHGPWSMPSRANPRLNGNCPTQCPNRTRR
jgi:hypothetical protein